jgi:hypothetical protein
MYFYADNVTMFNNVFYRHQSGWAIQIAPGAENWLIAHNTFAHDTNPYRDGYILLWGDHTNMLIKNNIFHQPSGAAMTHPGVPPNTGGQTNIVIQNNLVYGTSQMIDATTSEYTVSDNLLNVDPLLANIAA